MEARIQRATAVLELEAQHPTVQSAAFVDNEADNCAMIKLHLSTTSFKTSSQKNHTQTLVLHKTCNGLKVDRSPLEPVSEEVVATSDLHLGVWTVNFRSTSASRRIIEIVHTDMGVVEEIDVTDVHSSFLISQMWGQPQWLPGERMLFYVAERHHPNWNDKDKPYTAYRYEPNLGENLSDIIRPGLFVLDFSPTSNEAKVSSIEPSNLDEKLGVFFKQPAAAPRLAKDGPITLYAVGSRLFADGRRRGANWGQNLPDNIFQITIAADKTATAIAISADDRSARYPQVLVLKDSKSVLVYISNRRGHEHAGCSILHKRNLPLLDGHTELPDILVDTVREPDTPGGFPGLYPLATSTSRLLRSELNSTTSLYLAINVTWGCRKTIVTVNLRNGSVIDQCTGEMDSYVLLGSDGYQRLLATRSSMIVPPELVLGVLQPGAQPRIVWSTIKAWPYEFIDGKHFSNVNTLYSTIVPLPGWKLVEAMIVTAFPLDGIPNLPRKVQRNKIMNGKAEKDGASKSPPPTVLCIHGGPCNADTSFWRADGCLSLIAAGYTAVFVNYPGSIGYGQDFVEALTRDCGNLDVLACLEMQRHLVHLGLSSNDRGKRLFSAWSHGGFIGAHLSVRFPNEFDAIHIGGPVIDLPSNFATSDIPDWQLAQLGLKYDFNNPPSFLDDHEYEELRKRSPSHYAMELFKKTKGPCIPPTQIVLGSVDLRIPGNQGINWYHCLKGHSENVEMLVFPDNGHNLDKIWARPKNLEAQLIFLGKYSSFA